MLWFYFQDRFKLYCPVYWRNAGADNERNSNAVQDLFISIDVIITTYSGTLIATVQELGPSLARDSLNLSFGSILLTRNDRSSYRRKCVYIGRILIRYGLKLVPNEKII